MTDGLVAPRLMDSAGIGDTLRTEAARLGFRVLENLLLDAGDGTGQISYMLMDRFGMLLIDVEHYSGTITGGSDDLLWIAKPAGEKKQRFRNPLRTNDANRQVLHRVLIASGRNVPADYAQILVVFACAELGGLRLNDVDSMRVIGPCDLADFVRARYDFPPNHGAMDANEIGDLLSYLSSIDRSNDPDAVARHSDYTAMSNGARRSRSDHHASSVGPSIATQVIFKGGDRYPDGSQSRPVEPPQRFLPQLLALALVLAIAAWLFLAGGLPLAQDAARQAFDHASQAVASFRGEPQRPAPVSDVRQPLGYDVPLALQRLHEAAPDIYAGLTKPKSPRLSTTNGMPTYTWTYMRTRAGRKSIEAISITLGPQGSIVGVGRGGQ